MGQMMGYVEPYMLDRYRYIYDIGLVKADLSVVRSWKGVTRQETTMLVRLRCTGAVPPGEYLVYATEGEAGLKTSFCGLMPTDSYSVYLESLGEVPTIPLSQSVDWVWWGVAIFAGVGLFWLGRGRRHH